MAARSLRRSISIFRPLMDSLREPLKSNAGGANANAHGGSDEIWKKIFLFGCIPSLILCSIHIYLLEEHEPPEFRPYEHLRIRVKDYPWGDGKHTLFHNPRTNALPDGYEQ